MKANLDSKIDSSDEDNDISDEENEIYGLQSMNLTEI